MLDWKIDTQTSSFYRVTGMTYLNRSSMTVADDGIEKKICIII